MGSILVVWLVSVIVHRGFLLHFVTTNFHSVFVMSSRSTFEISDLGGKLCMNSTTSCALSMICMAQTSRLYRGPQMWHELMLIAEAFWSVFGICYPGPLWPVMYNQSPLLASCRLICMHTLFLSSYTRLRATTGQQVLCNHPWPLLCLSSPSPVTNAVAPVSA